MRWEFSSSCPDGFSLTRLGWGHWLPELNSPRKGMVHIYLRSHASGVVTQVVKQKNKLNLVRKITQDTLVWKACLEIDQKSSNVQHSV